MREKLIEFAYDILKNNKSELEFKDLWAKVLKSSNIDMEKAVEMISDFYSDLSLDNRFVGIEKTKWDLRERRTSKEVIVDTSHLLIDEEEEALEFVEEE